MVKDVYDYGYILAGPVGVKASSLAAAEALEDLAFGLLTTGESDHVQGWKVNPFVKDCRAHQYLELPVLEVNSGGRSFITGHRPMHESHIQARRRQQVAYSLPMSGLICQDKNSLAGMGMLSYGFDQLLVPNKRMHDGPFIHSPPAEAGMQLLFAVDDLGLQPGRETVLYHELVVNPLYRTAKGRVQDNVLVPPVPEVRARH